MSVLTLQPPDAEATNVCTDALQTPAEPLRLQASPAGQDAVEQQALSTQKPDVQSVPLVQNVPFGSGTIAHVPANP